ncbi:hypothetical protein JG688_00013366 [Phytophthora aleatoria]|uniref:Uncharacterized protein n=1 Tax=Phytophthora aleatoria TaxID=2496075 RepID=A0A8J5J0W1_9STRA|nr:hypothetical protein JG688_00013366 [Phytophthora aleatoria]
MCCGGRTRSSCCCCEKDTVLKTRLERTQVSNLDFQPQGQNMVASISGASRAIFALCSLIAAQGGFAAAQAADIGSCLTKAGVENSVPTTSTWAVDTEA